MSGAYSRTSGLIQRRNVASANSTTDSQFDEKEDKLDDRDVEEDRDSKETRLTLMEEVLLLGLKDREVM